MPPPDILPVEIPCPDTLRRLREEMGLSQSELAAELGFAKNGSEVVRGWECGIRNGQECRPTPLAWRALRFLAAMRRAVDHYRKTGMDDAAHAALAHLEETLPERVRP